MRLKNVTGVSTGRKASLSAQSCNLYRFFFFLTRFGLEFRIQAKSIQGGGLGLHLENCSLVDIHVRIFFIILRGCHIIQIGFRVVRRSLPPECWNYRLTETPPKAVKGSGFFFFFVVVQSRILWKFPDCPVCPNCK